VRKYQRNIMQRYDAQLNRILGSANIESIDYNLTYKFPQNMLNKSRLRRDAQKYDWTPCKNGILFLFKRLSINTQNVKKLTVTPTRGGAQWNPNNVTLFSENEFDEFVKYFPNLDTFIIANFHGHGRYASLESTVEESGIWSIFSQPYYWNRLKRIELNLTWITCIDGVQHPLFHIHKFKNLQKLKLTLSSMKSGKSYLKSMSDDSNGNLCADLKDISLTVCGGFSPMIMNKIWKYLLSFCPNMEHYTCLAPHLWSRSYSGTTYGHLIGHTDKLKTVRAHFNVFKPISTKLVSLTALHIHCSAFDEKLVNKLKHFEYTPNLETFVCTVADRLYWKDRWNGTLCAFVTYFAEHPNIGKLKSIRVQHANGNKKSIGTISSEQSLKICQALTSMSHIEHIRIHPLRLKRKELEYLGFWFDGAFGSMQTNKEIWNRSRGTCLLDIHLTNFSLCS